MSRSARLSLFGLAAAGLAALLGWGVAGLPAWGDFHGAYALLIDRVVVAQRHATDAVTGVNFDYRALDTLGEELILFTSVAGLAVLLREQRSEHERPSPDAGEGHRFQGASYALRAMTLALVGAIVTLSLYLSSHGQISPGGGFQGGVVGSAGLLMVFLGGGYLAMKRLSPHALVELGEASGAAGFALVGLGGLLFAAAFFQNFLGLGTPGQLLSAGTMPLSSMAIGLEVAGAFVLLWGEFFDQALAVRSR
jgi:multicomponent Na+:H+ antiporter subunit B